jgi:hypothetical protein
VRRYLLTYRGELESSRRPKDSAGQLGKTADDRFSGRTPACAATSHERNRFVFARDFETVEFIVRAAERAAS